MMWTRALLLFLLCTLVMGPVPALVCVLLWELFPFDRIKSQLVYRSMLAQSDILPAPITEQDREDLSTDSLRVGVCSMQGWRRRMEDSHTTLTSLSPQNYPNHSFFGVYDGHSGPDVAEWVSASLPAHLMASPHFKKGAYEAALRDAFVNADAELRSRNVQGGSTGVTVLLTPQGEVYCANVGDSRAVMSYGGVAVPLSFDHKPTLRAEGERIALAGGFVVNGRVLGSLAMSRAFGDFVFKRLGADPADCMVTVIPEVIRKAVTPSAEFIVVACDGIWDCATSQQVVSFVRQHLEDPSPLPLSKICGELFDTLMAKRPFGVGCDNMSMMIILLKHPRTYATASNSHEERSQANGAGCDGRGATTDDADSEAETAAAAAAATAPESGEADGSALERPSSPPASPPPPPPPNTEGKREEEGGGGGEAEEKEKETADSETKSL